MRKSYTVICNKDTTAEDKPDSLNRANCERGIIVKRVKWERGIPGRRMAAVYVIVLAGALVLQGCGKRMPADATEATNIESAIDSVETIEPDEAEKPTDSAEAEETGTEPDSSRLELATPATAGALRVEKTQLVDCNGNAVQLKGLSTHGLAWFPDYINEECFRQFREEWNVNVIRLAMYTAEGGGYCTDGNRENLKTLVRSGVEYATKQDMYVIIDWHTLSDNNPNAYIEEAKAFFAEMSEEYQDYNNVIYEICNEPNGGTSWNDIKSYALQVIETIRANDDDGIILVGTPNWSQYVDQAAADPITGYDNIMYTLHFYAATHTDWLRDSMKAAIADGLPIFVSEYGICDASGNGAIDEYQAEQWIKTMDDCGVSYVAWNISNKNETSAIFNSSCKKVSGFSESDLSASGKWLYRMLTEETDVTLTGNDEKSHSSAASGSGQKSDNNMVSGSEGKQDSNEVSESGQKTENKSADDSKVVLNSGYLSATTQVKSSWESEGKTFYQYELTIENTSDVNCDKWEIDLLFNGDIAFSDGWNGDYSVDGNALHITCKDYNGSIAAGESIGDIGFIVSGEQDLGVVE